MTDSGIDDQVADQVLAHIIEPFRGIDDTTLEVVVRDQRFIVRMRCLGPGNDVVFDPGLAITCFDSGWRLGSRTL